jgi:hypothetical protein
MDFLQPSDKQSSFFIISKIPDRNRKISTLSLHIKAIVLVHKEIQHVDKRSVFFDELPVISGSGYNGRSG